LGIPTRPFPLAISEHVDDFFGHINPVVFHVIAT
jgi:hypothetical protein